MEEEAVAEKEEINFEEAMKQLEKIANELETGNLSLEDSVTKFEQGMELSKKCHSILESAEKKITILIQDGNNVTEENFKRAEE